MLTQQNAPVSNTPKKRRRKLPPEFKFLTSLRPVDLFRGLPFGFIHSQYAKTNIGDLQPVSKRVIFTGTIVNALEHDIPEWEQGRRFSILVQDSTGTVCVFLHTGDVDPRIRLGQLVSVWTPGVLVASLRGFDHGPNVTHLVKIYLGRDEASFFKVHGFIHPHLKEDRVAAVSSSSRVSGLSFVVDITCGNFNNDDDMTVVAYCKRKEPAIKVSPESTRNPQGEESSVDASFSQGGKATRKRRVCLADATGSINLILHDYLAKSIAAWTDQNTVLLIQAPVIVDDGDGNPGLTAGPQTTIQVDPEVMDTIWLRDVATRDEKNAEASEDEQIAYLVALEEFAAFPKKLYTLSEANEQIQSHPQDALTGFFSLVIRGSRFQKLQSVSRLFGGRCCTDMVRGNQSQASCSTCRAALDLRYNPSLFESFSDESGSIEGKSLPWTKMAMEKLLQTSQKAVEIMTPDQLKDMDSKLDGRRVNVTFAYTWTPDDVMIVLDLSA